LWGGDAATCKGRKVYCFFGKGHGWWGGCGYDVIVVGLMLCARGFVLLVTTEGVFFFVVVQIVWDSFYAG